MRLCFARCSEPSARLIEEAANNIHAVRSSEGHINWGRETANTDLNPDIRNATNKQRMRELFEEHGVPTPKSYDIRPRQRVISSWFPIVGRSEKHTKGRGFWLCKTYEDVQKAFRGTRRKKPASHFMEFIEHDREYRVHVFKGKSLRISEKEFFIDENGKKDYITKKPGDIKLRRVRKAAKQAVEAIGLDFGAVDILARGDDNAEVWVLEVNAAPGLGGSMPQVYADAFERWWEGDW